MLHVHKSAIANLFLFFFLYFIYIHLYHFIPPSSAHGFRIRLCFISLVLYPLVAIVHGISMNYIILLATRFDKILGKHNYIIIFVSPEGVIAMSYHCSLQDNLILLCVLGVLHFLFLYERSITIELFR